MAIPCGSKLFMAPEMAQFQKKGEYFCGNLKKCDVFSLGVILYFLLNINVKIGRCDLDVELEKMRENCKNLNDLEKLMMEMV